MQQKVHYLVLVKPKVLHLILMVIVVLVTWQLSQALAILDEDDLSLDEMNSYVNEDPAIRHIYARNFFACTGGMKLKNGKCWCPIGTKLNKFGLCRSIFRKL